ncbi:MAG: hypothetical protein ACLFMZ_11635, partial [Spirochaetaceae bacterium]
MEKTAFSMMPFRSMQFKKRRVILFTAVLLLTTSPLFSQSIGGGLSFFVPESLLHKSGSLSNEAGLSTSIGFGDIVSVPVGFTYMKASGLMAYDKNDNNKLERISDEIWYTADTFIPYLRLQAHIPLGPVFIRGIAGGVGAWFIAPQLNEGAIGRTFASETDDDFYAFDDLSMNAIFGYGYQAGTSIGVEIDRISVQITALFTDIFAPTTAKSDTYYKINYANETVDEDTDFKGEFISRLRGISVGLGGSYEM